MNGIGANIHLLSGGTDESADKYYGRKIKDAKFDKGNDYVRLEFEDGVAIRITDEGQSCCESRYMTMDDDIKDIIGQKLVGILVKYADGAEGSDDSHEVAFLELKTDQDSVVFCTHVEHNGYYGGFGLNIKEEK